MSNLRAKVNNDEKLTSQDKYYWNYMYDLGRDFIVPYLSGKGIFKSGYKVSEIGSAEGVVIA